jgi:hypothetical protein
MLLTQLHTHTNYAAHRQPSQHNTPCILRTSSFFFCDKPQSLLCDAFAAAEALC